ncbi:amino acid ABC transporter substrate-binding protein (plasmid) [Bacillus cereus]|uniref:amino acid ABC transporter substrate-binding protein n=1 Tax=Bacillus cereus group TaxID=86661 RepID=UPI0002FD0DA6|nr:amino acid ABC transporter substrate-binding protein [Bacillus cereus]AJH60391.1 bacterial extracellular solute-binding s, 3 family protein [Bacillus cereus]AJK37490.1 bacterial extracellular solute-binding s, 3 family protein [Bacillus cereus]QKH69366.1 amino acid ABC transporter substrate-binding protein [Bacillus cereus]QKH71463.1 amino acid ABC transporter substrate-binding protein [Bacillus cereus]
MKRLTTIILIIAAVFAVITGCSKPKEKEDNTLVIGIDDKFAPMGFRDENNKIVGFDIDYAKAAAEKLGTKVKFQPIDWKTKESELSSGRIDLIWNGYTITDDRKNKVLFTKPYLKNAQVVVTLSNSPLTKLNNLEAKVVGLQSLSSASDALNSNPIKSKIKTVTEFADNVSALNDLKSGRLDAVVIDEVVINYYMTKEKDTFKILDESLSPEEYGVGVKKGNDALLKKLQKALDEMNRDGTAAEISKKWFGEYKILK